jgi:magnesium transporter
MITTYYKPIQSGSLPTVAPQYSPDSWIYVENPNPDELEEIAMRYGLEYDLLQDAIDAQELPRVEIEKDTLYVFTRYVHRSDLGTVETAPVLYIVKKNVFISISLYAFPGIQQFLNGKINVPTNHKAKLLLKLLSFTHETYTMYLNDINRNLRRLTVRVEKVKNRDIIQFVSYEDMLYDFSFALLRMQSVIAALQTGKFGKFTEAERDKMEELMQDNTQLVQYTKESLQSIVNIREAYSTLMTNSLNKTIKLFTSLTVLLTIPTIIGTFFGMNVTLPFADWHHMFSAIVATSLSVMVLLGIIFFYKDWL